MSTDVDSLSETAQDTSAFYYTAANHNFLLESDIKTEIVEQLSIFPMPHSPVWCSGMISLRGKIIPVLDMAHMLQTEPNDKARWLLVLESTPLPQIAIKIDSLPARLSFNDEHIKPLEVGEYPNWLYEMIQTDDLTLLKADHSALFQQLIDHNSALATPQNQENDKQNSSEDDA